MNHEERRQAPARGEFRPAGILDSRPTYLVLSLIAAGLVGISWILGGGWVSVLFFGLLAAWAARRLANRRVRVTIMDHSFVDENLPLSRLQVRWCDVSSIRSAPHGLIEVLLASDVDPGRTSPLVRGIGRLLHLGPILVTPWGLEWSRDRILEALLGGLQDYNRRDLARFERADWEGTQLLKRDNPPEAQPPWWDEPSCDCFDPNRSGPGAVPFHADIQDTHCHAWRHLMELIEQAAVDGWTEFAPFSLMTYEDVKQIVTLPPSIAELRRVRTLNLYGSHLVRIPREIGQLSRLREFDPYTSYRLHWFPYEITRCRALRDSRISHHGRKPTPRRPYPM
jgi:hypothetical protein